MRASDSSTKISGNADLAALQIEYADSTTDPNSPNYDPNADPIEVAAQQQIKFNQNFNDNLRTNNKDTQPTTGPIQPGSKPGTTKGASQVVHALASDTVATGGNQHELQALASIQSKQLDSPTQKVAGLENLSIRDFDNAHRV